MKSVKRVNSLASAVQRILERAEKNEADRDPEKERGARESRPRVRVRVCIFGVYFPMPVAGCFGLSGPTKRTTYDYKSSNICVAHMRFDDDWMTPDRLFVTQLYTRDDGPSFIFARPALFWETNKNLTVCPAHWDDFWTGWTSDEFSSKTVVGIYFKHFLCVCKEI